MLYTKAVKPDFYSRFMEKGFFPNANKIIKYQESHNYWIFKTGNKVYKVKKRENAQSTIALEEVFCNEIVRLISQYSPTLEPVIATIKKRNDSFLIDKDNSVSSQVLYYLIIMNQLPDRHFLDVILEKGKLTEENLNNIGSFLCRSHDKAEISKSKEDGTPDTLNAQLQDLIYQSKKYVGVTISQATIDMVLRPLEKYLIDNRKLLLRRIKKGAIRQVHGCFIPRKIHIRKKEVTVLARTTDPLRHRFNDVAADVADLAVELIHAGCHESSHYFIDQYSKLTGDRELKPVLPIYQAMKCLSLGLKHSIIMKQLKDDKAERQQTTARQYYEQAIDVVHQL